MNLPKDLSELINAGVISQETAKQIDAYYQSKSGDSTNRLFVIFGVIGAILVSLGIILILAHNWDIFPRYVKTTIAFIPLLIGQFACGYTLIKQPNSKAWKEGSATFLLLSVGAAISLVSQIYHIPGNLSSFLFVWLLLGLPLVYLLSSSVCSLLYIIGTTYYAAEIGYFSYTSSIPYFYLLLLLLILPHYFNLYRNHANSNVTFFHHWLVPLSLTATLGTIARSEELFMFVAYFNLFGIFYLIGNSDAMFSIKSRANGYRVVGLTGIISLLFTLSFDWYWHELSTNQWEASKILSSPEFYGLVITSLGALVSLFVLRNQKSIRARNPLSFAFLFVLFSFFVGLVSTYAAVLINLFILGTSIVIIRHGAKKESLGLLNTGLLMVTVLIACRFFDTDLSFIVRGLLFVLVGFGFFIANYTLLKRKRSHE